MNTFLNRCIAATLLMVLCVMFFFQSVALAGPRVDGGDDTRSVTLPKTTIRLPSRINVFGKTLKPSVANDVDSQPRAGEDVREFRARTGRGSDAERDRERGDMVKEVTGERHIGRGGPQNP